MMYLVVVLKTDTTINTNKDTVVRRSIANPNQKERGKGTGRQGTAVVYHNRFRYYYVAS